MFEQLQVLCFDLDDTLWDVQRVLRRAEDQVDRFLEQNYPGLVAHHDRGQMRAVRLELARVEPQRAHDLTWLRTESMRRLAMSLGYPEAVGEEAFEVFIAARNEIDFYPDVLPALESLGRRYRLASFSNGNADLRRVGIAGHFAVSLSARDVGAAKPDPRSFAAVVDAMGVEPGQIAYVGDDPDLDIAGARGAGLRTIWIHRDRRAWPDGLDHPDLSVADLAALESAVGASLSRASAR